MNDPVTTHAAPFDLASLGEGQIAYMRQMSSDEMRARFPAAKAIQAAPNSTSPSKMN